MNADFGGWRRDGKEANSQSDVSIGNPFFVFLRVFASALSIMLAVFFTATMFAASDFRMGGPPVKVLVGCR